MIDRVVLKGITFTAVYIHLLCTVMYTSCTTKTWNSWRLQ